MSDTKNLEKSSIISNKDFSKISEAQVNKLAKYESQKVEFVNMTEDDVNELLEKFIVYSDDGGIEWDRFNYEIFDYSFYKTRFPKFDDDIIDILVKCSKTKLYDDTNIFQKPKKYEEKDFVLVFE